MTKKSFSGVVSSFKSDAIAACGETRKAVAIELFKSVILDTPVDEGRLRANWQATTDNPATGQLDIYDENGGGTVALAVKTVNQSNNDQVLYLVNNLPYALAIEYGHSDQAPKGMVRRNMVRISGLIKKAIRENKV
ncbi:hypothetical protein [Endozoicomonas sp. GU-1]|uniref:hypothetical protein n=1 Tax=Endozoicomonas sp. GU-1 TaxID=3009078 RepID=UPI0022B5CB06|nr:hypothetical protein [Endozoicomonas sp. GU-1]WBA79555.1 hypothetical protein O2T12_14320 [Endozoicomonas sp. GU-1]